MSDSFSSTQSFEYILAKSPLYISRLISHVAHGIGIPISYFPLSDSRLLAGSARVSFGNSGAGRCSHAGRVRRRGKLGIH